MPNFKISIITVVLKRVNTPEAIESFDLQKPYVNLWLTFIKLKKTKSSWIIINNSKIIIKVELSKNL